MSVPSPSASGVAGRRAAVDAVAEPAQLLLGGVAVGQAPHASKVAAARCELARRARPPRRPQRARDRRASRDSAASITAPTCSAAAADASARSAAAAGSPACRATAPAARCAQAFAIGRPSAAACASAPPRPRARPRRAARAPRRPCASASRPIARQAPGIDSSAPRPAEDVDGALAAPADHGRRARDRHRRPGREDALVQPPRQLQRLLGHLERRRDVAGDDRQQGAVAQHPRQALRDADQSRRFDAVVEHRWPPRRAGRACSAPRRAPAAASGAGGPLPGRAAAPARRARTASS